MEGFIGELKLVHRVETPTIEVVFYFAAGFVKESVQDELHHQKSGAQIELVIAQLKLSGTASNRRLLF